MPATNAPTQHSFTPRTHVRVQRSDGREWPSMAVAYRELIGTAQELGHSEHMRLRASLRAAGTALDRHGFTWRALGGQIAEETINWTDFTFGVELEVTAPFGQSAMRSYLMEAGASNWRVVRDGSLSVTLPNHEAMEVVSPVLQGEDGLTQLKGVLDLLRTRGCKVNSSCGMHVHIGVRGMNPARVRKIALAYLNAEHHFDAVVPPARRSNRYAQSNRGRINRDDVATLGNATAISTIARCMNGGTSHKHYNSFRYYRLNFQSFVHHGTIEFRQHSGTVESEKAAQWVRLVAGFCAWAARSEQQQYPQGQVDFNTWLANCTDGTGAAFMIARRAKFEGRSAVQTERV